MIIEYFVFGSLAILAAASGFILGMALFDLYHAIRELIGG